MGDRRKLQGEIDRCLKKVTEGVETFEDIWQKVHTAPNHNQKDKYEQELKKEIKKLQRLRDQIKAWISSTEIKDKKQLQEARKNIEQQMERFKIVERETKTKAYSKEGLGAGQKLDPQEKEKEECAQWITEAIHELNIQADKFEADIEALSASLKKKKSDKDKQERLEETKHSIERHKFHIESLEKILRAINNDALDPKILTNLRADIEYYVESNQESDFKENDMMYEEIDMDDLNNLMAPVMVVPAQSHSSSLSNGTSGSLNSNTTSNHIDLSSSSSININSSTNHSSDRMTSAGNSNHGDNESAIGLTTPSSTQASSPSASPALSLTDDRKRNKSESEDNHSQRNRTNSGATNSSINNVSSPKTPSQTHQSPNVSSSSTKSVLSSAPSLSTSAPPHFTYPTTTTTTTTTSTLPVLQYAAIVSQNTTPTTSSNTSASKQTNILSPQTKQTSRQLPNGTNTTTNTNDSIVTTTSTSSTTITNSSNTSHPPSLLSSTSTTTSSTNNNDRQGILPQHILNNISQSSPTSTSSSLYTNSGSNSNIPQYDSTSSIDPSIISQQTSRDTDRSAILSNGSSDSHLESTFSPSSFLPTNSSSTNLSGDLPSTNGGSVLNQLANNIPINPDHHSLRYMLSSNMIQQQQIPTGRVPLTQAEMRMLNRLNSAYAKLPSLLESERQRTNANRIYGRGLLGPSQMVPYYPQTPPSGSDTPEFYYRLAPDTLFFVFYYMEGTRAQYLAAKALKRQSWRFHTKHMMWFQRHEEPKTITDDYEQGTYIFFDYERWQTRKRDNFVFEYKFLEDREF